MKILRGKVDCNAVKTLGDDSIATISVIDCTLMDAPAKTIGKVVLKDLKTFPFEYEVEYNQNEVNIEFEYGFAVSCRIETNGKLSFINDTRHLVISDGKIQDNVDISVIVVRTN